MKPNHLLFLGIIVITGILFTGCSSSEESQKDNHSAGSQTITSSSGANGTIAPSGSLNINNGGTTTYTITPAMGYHIDSVIVDGTSIGAVSNYTFTNIALNHTIRATFTNDHTISNGDTVTVNKQNTERPLYNSNASATPPTDTSGSMPQGKFSVQIGAYKMPDNADRIVALAKERFTQHIYLFFDKTDNSYKVLIGDFTIKDDARTFRDQMAQQFPGDYKDAWVRDNSQN